MRVTKAWLRDVRSRVAESQAKLCAMLALGNDAVWEEHKIRFPNYVGGRPRRDAELLRQLLYDDLFRIIPDVLVD